MRLLPGSMPFVVLPLLSPRYVRLLPGGILFCSLFPVEPADCAVASRGRLNVMIVYGRPRIYVNSYEGNHISFFFLFAITSCNCLRSMGLQTTYMP